MPSRKLRAASRHPRHFLRLRSFFWVVLHGACIATMYKGTIWNWRYTLDFCLRTIAGILASFIRNVTLIFDSAPTFFARRPFEVNGVLQRTENVNATLTRRLLTWNTTNIITVIIVYELQSRDRRFTWKRGGYRFLSYAKIQAWVYFRQGKWMEYTVTFSQFLWMFKHIVHEYEIDRLFS